MTTPTQNKADRARVAKVELEALARIERLVDATTPRQRDRIMAGASEAVRTRVAALETKLTSAGDALPTLIPGSGELDEVALPPGRVGAFRLTERLGRGGMGEVWAGSRDDGLYDQRVAIKLIQRHALARAAAAFDEERRFLARLEHPNIARLIDGGVTEDGLPWLAMEYVDGLAIDEAAADRPLAERVAMFVKAADAVQHAHSRMVVHADLKPSNILVGHDGRLKLLDFGIAQLIDETPHPDRPGAAGGAVTREFASPQRLDGGGPSVADDVYALGCTLDMILEGAPDRELTAIAAKAHAGDEVKRYGSVAELIADVERWRARLPVTALPATWRYRAGKFVERHRWGVGATAVALILLSATTLIATSSYFRAEGSKVRAEARFGEVRDLSRFMLFDLYDALARRPGTVGERGAIAATSARYLDRLNISGETGIDLRLETARSYRRLAAIEGLPGISNLGRPARSTAALDRADAILRPLVKEQPRNVLALTELGWVQADRWLLHADDSQSPVTNRDAKQWFDAALAIDPTDISARLGQLTTERNRGYELIWVSDKPAAAIPVLRNAIVGLRKVNWPADYQDQVRRLEINTLNRLGDALYYADDIPGSLTPYREAQAITEHAIAREGAIPQWLIIKGENAFNISGSLGDSGHEQEALDVAAAGIADLKQMLTFGVDAGAEKKLLVLYGQQSALLRALKRDDEALAPSLASIALRERRLARSANDPQRARDLAIGLMPHAELLAEIGRPTEACAAATRAVAQWHAIRAKARLGALDARKNLPKSEALKAQFCR